MRLPSPEPGVRDVGVAATLRPRRRMLGLDDFADPSFRQPLGITPNVAAAMSLAKRVRELGLGIPGLVVWQLRRR